MDEITVNNIYAGAMFLRSGLSFHIVQMSAADGPEYSIARNCVIQTHFRTDADMAHYLNDHGYSK